jgi:hypothetical protein
LVAFKNRIKTALPALAVAHQVAHPYQSQKSHLAGAGH